MLLRAIRRQSPLVHHLTNWVTIADCAQITRCVGALPVMAHMADEVADMVTLAASLVLNIGTLDRRVVDSMLIAGETANAHGIPVVLDIVGCGATPARSAVVKELTDALQFAVIKGNYGEIGAAAGARAEVRGVESISVSGDMPVLAAELARRTGAVVVVTGQIDLITDGDRLHRCTAGHPLMGAVVGTGCMATSILGAFVGVSSRFWSAAGCAMEFYGAAAETAATRAETPMAFKSALLDSVYTLAHGA
jgi:hydroxyethylthiazole kinase